MSAADFPAALIGPPRAYPPVPLADQIASMAAQRPQQPAVRFNGQCLNYQQLNERANALAHHLIADGVGPGTRVAVFTLRDLSWPVAILAVLKTGAAYVPLDSQYPDDRVAFILKDCGAVAVLASADLRPRLPRDCAKTTVVDDRIAPRADAPSIAATAEARLDSPCWALYTSGSTGKPKGALLKQRAIVSFYSWFAEHFGVTEHTRALVMTSPGFDLTQRMTLMPLTQGACITLAPTEHYDATALREVIAAEGIDLLSSTPSGFYGLIDDGDDRTWQQLASVRTVVPGGEIIQGQRLAAWQRNPLCRATVHNSYGPTETHDLITTYALGPADYDAAQVRSLGKPLANVELRILDDAMQPVPHGEVGLLYVAGLHVGYGYLNLPEKTAEAFVEDPTRPGEHLYKVGDLVRVGDDGNILFVGRRDHQVKVRGWRIELPEVEGAILAHPAVQEAVVTAPEDDKGERRLLAYVQPRVGMPLDPSTLRRHLQNLVPDYMLPSAVVMVDSFPINANGKVDRTHLPVPPAARPALATPFAGPRGKAEAYLASQWEGILGFAGVGRDDTFFELGGSSLQATQLMGRLGRALGLSLPVSGLFAAPTVSRLAAHLSQHHAEALTRLGLTDIAPAQPMRTPAPAPTAANPASAAIAIVGMAVRLPDADTPEAFWQQLLAGHESLRPLSEEELRAAGVGDAQLQDPSYVRRSAILANAYDFDAAYFGYTPREAEAMDPQQRVLLECAHHALEHAGIPVGVGARVGVYLGVAHNRYQLHNLASYRAVREDPSFGPVLGGDKDFVATRVAFKLHLTGPAVNVQAACATSGVALHLACQAIKNGDCEAAIVGGARINTPQGGYPHVDGGPESKDGHVRAFSAEASGMVLTSGAACLVVKRLDQALADGDCVYAIVKGTALNNDGAAKMAYTAPSEQGQAEVIAAALQASGLTASDIQYIEAHGTGTLLGDPIEVAALSRAYAAAPAGSIGLGSVKSNIGHLDAGAGAAAMVKTAMALKHQALPPSLHAEPLNAECGFGRNPFSVVTQTREAADLRHAGVSSFGFGGTNFHGILAAPPAQNSGPARRAAQVLRLSARTEPQAKALAARVSGYLADHLALPLSDIAYTLDRGRGRMPWRVAITARTTAEAASALHSASAVQSISAPSLCFMFPGQGAQHPNMGRALYEREAVYRSAIDNCCLHLEPLLGVNLKDILYPAVGQEAEAAERLRNTHLAQPAIFAVSYATAKLLESWGLQADAYIGHSVGEFVAATLAGVFELEHALLVLAERARLMQSMPSGSMLAVRLGESEVQKLLPDGLAIAALNAPQLTVVSGPADAIHAFANEMQTCGVGAAPLHTSHAFHSNMMDPACAPLAAVIARLPRAAPKRPIVSTLTGEWVDADTLQDPHYWARQLREPVRFAPALSTLLHTPGRVLLEVGPGQNLSTSAKQIGLSAHGAVSIASLPHAAESERDAQEHLIESLGKLWCAGIELDPARYYAGEQRLKLGLPGMAFDRQRYYIPPAADATTEAAPAPMVATAPAAEAAPAAAGNAVQEHLIKVLRTMTGLDFGPGEHEVSFLEMGLDSLMLTQVAGRLKAEFKVDIKFRQLMEDYTSVTALTAFLAAHSQGTPGMTATAAKAVAASNAPDTVINLPQDGDGKPKTFGAGAKISKIKGEHLSERQEAALASLTERYIAKTRASKDFAQANRRALADPRTVSGFRPVLKELIYPIVTPKSQGAYLWDLDGNQYVDVTCGFGSMFFGHRAPFVVDAVEKQLKENGYEIGPQSPLAGECAQLVAELTGLPRVAFCATGSEAVLAAMRTARTVTGKNLVVMFNGDYHGMFDEVIYRGTPSLRTVPAAPGIPMESVANTLILDFGSKKSLEIIEQRADDIAAVIVEPVQSRRCDFQPRDFHLALRGLTEKINAAYVFDEIVTGFRASIAGAQGYFGIQADMGTYGKVIGGGLPIGVIAGVPKFMDALDGGHWQFGDDSVPEVGVTYFAGTFVRHPLSLAACKAACLYLKANPDIYADVNRRTARMVETINLDFQKANAPLHLAHFTSLWKPEYTTDQSFGELLYMYLREAGIHIWDGRPCFLSVAHTDADAEAVIDGFRYAVSEMQKGGFFAGTYKATEPLFNHFASAYRAPLPGARVGRDARGNPAWFVPDPAQAGRFVQLEIR